MAQWNQADRTLHAKLVYYGPAYGGKTTTLEALHRITDAAGANELISIRTADDRTLFFDLLPFDLGDILGYQVAMKLYTVPGQVRYDTTRQVVLAGADALVFVADSSTGRREQNVWSWQNLRMNMRAKGLDPKLTPVVFQFNKQDLPDAAPAHQVAGWLEVSPDRGFASVATEGRGVLEPFMTACRAMMERIVTSADAATRERIETSDLAAKIDRAFAPFVERVRSGEVSSGNSEADAPHAIFLGSDDLLESSVQSTLALGERLADGTARTRRLENTVALQSEEIRRAGEELGSVDEMKGRFLAGLSHEIRSPLTAILGAAHVMRDYRSNATERKELVESIIESAHILKDQFEAMFRLVSLDKSSPPEIDEVPPAAVAEEAIALSGHSGIQFKIEHLSERIRVDATGLTRGVANLIDNAVKFSPSGSLVRIVMRGSRRETDGKKTQELSISVFDRGPGVPEADRVKIFRPFEQGGDNLTDKPRGVGIGLCEAREHARRNGGDLEYFPRKGGGSEFRITVPLEPRTQPAVLEEQHV